MQVLQRDRQIRELRKKDKTLKEISDKFNLSSERVRQICTNLVDKKDVYRNIDVSYKQKIISQADYNWLKREIVRLRKPDRKKGTVIERRNLVRYMHDKMNLSLLQISVALDRHHTSILNLYYSSNNL